MMKSRKDTENKVTERAKKLYDEYTFGEFSYGRKRVKYYSLLEKVLGKLPEGGCIYDVGCGRGFWFDVYREVTRVDKSQIIGIDLSPRNIFHIRELGYEGYVENILELGLPDSVSDVTISIGVIHHTVNPFKAFAQLVRITKQTGFLYIAVYNKRHPYYYIVHKATWPLRLLYWQCNQRWIPDFLVSTGRIIFQPLARVILGEWLDKKTAKTMFMDQVMTPRASLFSKKDLERYAAASNCKLIDCRYMLHSLMLEAIFKKK